MAHGRGLDRAPQEYCLYSRLHCQGGRKLCSRQKLLLVFEYYCSRSRQQLNLAIKPAIPFGNQSRLLEHSVSVNVCELITEAIEMYPHVLRSISSPTIVALRTIKKGRIKIRPFASPYDFFTSWRQWLPANMLYARYIDDITVAQINRSCGTTGKRNSSAGSHRVTTTG